MRDVYRVERSESEVIVSQMSKKDAAGNVHFICIAKLRSDDVVYDSRHDKLIAIADASTAVIVDSL